MFKKLLLLFLSFIYAFSIEVNLTQQEKEWIKNHPNIVLGTDSSWIPFVLEEKGKLSGYDIDVLNLINQKTGANFQLQTGKWKEIVEKAKNKEIDGLSTSAVHKERAEFFNFSNSYVSTQKFLIILNINSSNIKSSKDLVGKKIAYQENNLFDKKLISQYENSEHIPMESLDSVVDNLVLGNVDAIVGNHEVFYMIEKKKLPYVRIIESIPNSKLNLVFSVRNDYPEALSILNKGLESITYEEKKELEKKWFSTPQIPKNKLNKLNLTKEEKEYLKNKKVLTVANLEELPPFNFNENGIPKGYSVDYMNIVGEYLDIEIDFISNRSWNEYILMLKNKEIDIVPHVAVNEERKEYIDFTNFNHIEYTTGMAIEKNSEIKSIEDLKDKITSVPNNTFIHAYFKKNFPSYSLLLTPSTAKALEAVSLNQAHVVIGNLPTLNYYIQKNWLTNVKIVNIDNSDIGTKTSLPIGVSKGEIVLKSILEKVNEAISHNEITNLKQKWMNQTIYSNELIKEEVKYLKDKKTIKMCVLPDWLPFEYIDENGKHGGIGADVVKRISKYIETPIELVSTKEWAESLQNIKDRKCDILPIAMDIPSRKDSMDFTTPYFSEPFVVATKNDQLFIKDSNSLSGKKIGVVKSYAFVEVLKTKNPSIEVVSVRNVKEALEKVSSGELYGYVDTMPTIGYGIQKYGMVDLKIAGKLEFDIKLSVATRNDEPILNGIMQKALDSISDEEKIKIVSKWVEIKVSQEFDYNLLWQICGVFSFVLLVVLYKNRTVVLLNKELLKAKKEIDEQQKMVDKYVLILSIDKNGIITDVNEAFTNAVKYTKDELIGGKFSILMSKDEEKTSLEEMVKSLQVDNKWVGELKGLTKIKEVIWMGVYIESKIIDNIHIGYRAVCKNLTDRKRIEELSVTDKLTGLYNRLKLDEVLTMRIEEFKRYKTEFSILLLDIDDFKKINDTYGHDVGDYVLKTVAKTLKENTRTTDVVGRWGGEEFIIVCENTNLDGSKTLAEHLRDIVYKTNFEKVGNITISLGIAEFKENDTISSVFKRADNRLYIAKTTGKNRVGV